MTNSQLELLKVVLSKYVNKAGRFLEKQKADDELHSQTFLNAIKA